MKEGYSTVSIKSEDIVEPLLDEPKLTERSDDYVILPKEELHKDDEVERSRTELRYQKWRNRATGTLIK
jgi:hypothetical protein